LTTATSGAAKLVLIFAFCPLPLTAVITAADPAVLVSVKLVDSAPAVAVTLYDPVIPFAVSAGEVAWPSTPVTTIADPPNVALAPDSGAVNVTLTPDTGLPPESFAITTSGLGKPVLICALCPPPLTGEMLAAEPAVFVSEKVVDNAPAVALTL
jgi:hypothetical protein